MKEKKISIIIPCYNEECILRPSAVTIPFWSGRFTEQNGRNVAIDYPLL